VRRPSAAGHPVVVKVGSSSLTGNGGLDEKAIGTVVDQIAELRSSGTPAVLVTSGAVAAGLPSLDLDERPSDIPGLQAAAAVGQGRLMETYTRLFSTHGLVAGQVLLTRDVLANRDQYLHAKQALGRMLELGVVPIVNENDTVVVDELRLGDNDRLAAIVSHLTGAGMLVILTDTDGLFSGDPRFDDSAELLDAVRSTDAVLEAIAGGSSGPLGSGGVATKVAAARMAAWSGIPTGGRRRRRRSSRHLGGTARLQPPGSQAVDRIRNGGPGDGDRRPGCGEGVGRGREIPPLRRCHGGDR